MAETVYLQRPSDDVPWGFRLHGGRDFQVPLTVQKVTAGSVAATGLNPGDVIVAIGDSETGPLTHTQAMQAIKDCGNILQLRISRYGNSTPVYTPTIMSPTVGTPLQTNDRRAPLADYTPTHTSDYPFASDSTYQTYTNGGPPDYSHLDTELQQGNIDLYDSTLTGYDQQQQASTRDVRQSPQPQVPDAVINMAARAGKDKKPFAYVADVNDIREQRDRVRKRNPVSSLPRYQHMLNMPQFEESTPPPRIRSVPSSPQTSAPVSSSPSDAAVVANLQFNSPLGLYSGDNVVEALKGQTGGQISGVVGLPKKDKGDITQSAVYKMIHGIDQPTKQRQPVTQPTEGRVQMREPTAVEELKFTGLNRGEIPSKSFQRLQSMTGTGGSPGPGPRSEIDTTSIRRNVTGNAPGDDQEVGQYEQKSIRYTGRNIPSRSFRMLQSMTGGEDSTASPARELSSDDEVVRVGGVRSRSETPSRPVHRSQPQQQQQQQQYQQPQQHTGGSEIDTTSIRHNLLGGDEPDVGEYEQASIRYTGKNIPSRSFRMLQQMTGGDSTPPVATQSLRRDAGRQQHQQQHRSVRIAPSAASADDQNEVPASDVRYTGANIPSQSFRILQQSIGPDTTDGAVNGGSDTLQSSGGRRVKVVRLRQQSSTEDKGATDF